MITLIPVCLFSVRYEIIGGRPYSQFEQLVLRGIHNGLTSLGALEPEFNVHSRLIIEALVTLTQAGWIAVGEKGFTLTEEGRRAMLSGDVPESRLRAERLGKVLMERLTGGVISSQRATFVTEADLRDASKWETAFRIQPRIHESELDAGQVQHCLAKGRNEWISRIDRIRLNMKGNCWLPVNVDFGRARASLIPSEWHARLEDIVLRESERLGGRSDVAKEDRWTEKVNRRGVRQSSQGEEFPDALGGRWSVAVKEKDFIFSARNHRSLLLEALEQSKAQVFIVSAFLRLDVLQELQEAIYEAIRRGVYIDVLWGFSGNSEESGVRAVDFLQTIAAEAVRNQVGRGRIRFNRNASGSHAKILLWDTWTGVKGCVGSYNWLSARSPIDEGNKEENNASVCFSHPGVLSAVARTISGLWTRVRSERLGSTSARLDVISTDLDKLNARSVDDHEENKAMIGLVRDLEHEGLLRAMLRSPKQRFFLSSYHLSKVGALRLSALSGADNWSPATACVAFGENMLGDEEARIVEAELAEHGVTVKRVAGLHAKVCVSDQAAYVGSYNFLSGDPFGTAVGSREMGVVISGMDTVSTVAEWCERWTST